MPSRKAAEYDKWELPFFGIGLPAGPDSIRFGRPTELAGFTSVTPEIFKTEMTDAERFNVMLRHIEATCHRYCHQTGFSGIHDVDE